MNECMIKDADQDHTQRQACANAHKLLTSNQPHGCKTKLYIWTSGEMLYTPI